MSSFSEVVKKVAASKGIKNKELARMTGYSSQHISDLLSGERRWNEDSINKVCTALDLKIKFEVQKVEALDHEFIF